MDLWVWFAVFRLHSSLIFMEAQPFHSFFSFGLWPVPRYLLENIHGLTLFSWYAYISTARSFAGLSATTTLPHSHLPTQEFCVAFPMPHWSCGDPVSTLHQYLVVQLPIIVSALMLRITDEYTTNMLGGKGTKLFSKIRCTWPSFTVLL